MSSWRTFPYWMFAFLVLTVALSIWRWDILLQPPYWGAAMGNFTYASHLAVDDVSEDGVRAIPAVNSLRYSFVPYLTAGIMKLTPNATYAIIVFRLLTFLCASLTLILLAWWLQSRLGWGPAIWSAAAILTTPVFIVQVEQLGLEMFVIAGVTLATVLLLSDVFVLAALAGLIAFYAKWTGIAYLAAALLYLIVQMFHRAERRGPVLVGFLAHLVAILVAVGTLYLGRNQDLPWGGWVYDDRFGASPLVDAWRWVPDLVAVLGVTALLMLLVLRNGLRVGGTEGRVKPQPTDPAILFPLFFLSIALGLFGVCKATPGQLALFVPFVILWFAWVIQRWEPGRLAGMSVMFLLIGFNLVNSYGRFLPPFPDDRETIADLRTGALRERSREYLADQASYGQAVIKLAGIPKDRMVVTSSPMVHYLSLPALGYIIEPLQGYSVSEFTTKRFAPVHQLRDVPFQSLIVAFIRNRYSINNSSILPKPGNADDLIYKDEAEVNRKSPLVVFALRNDHPEDLDLAKQSYLRRFWPTSALMREVLVAFEQGNEAQAEEILKVARAANPQYGTAHYLLGFLKEKRNDIEGALSDYARVSQTSSDYWQAQRQVFGIRSAAKDYEGADAALVAAISAYRRMPDQSPRVLSDMLVKRAGLASLLQKPDEANQLLKEAVGADSTYPTASRMLAASELAAGRTDLAMSHLRYAIQLDSKDPDSYRLLAIAYLQLKQWDLARKNFSEALALRPSDIDSQDGLAKALIGMERFEDAIAEYEDLLARGLEGETRSQVLIRLADAQKLNGQWKSAIGNLREAVKTVPESPAAINELAWALATSPVSEVRSSTEAIQLAEGITQGTEPSSAFLDTLAAAYADAGDFAKAVATIQRAIERAQAENRADFVEGFQARLKMYESGQPYRDAEKG